MLYRNVIEQLDTDQLKYDKYIFVGFNVLNKVEKEFFRKLQKADKAIFYWDYDIFYTQQIKNMRPENLLTATWKISRTNCLPATLTP